MRGTQAAGPGVPQKRVAFVSHTAELTGAAMSFYTLLSGLDRRYYRCFPILPHDGPLLRRLREDAYDPKVVDFAGWSKLSAVSKTRHYLTSQNIDLVYLSGAHKFSRLINAFFAASTTST